jgi:D-xylulose reductase
MAVAKALGASRIVAVDIVENRLEFAKTYAATEIYLPLIPSEREPKLEFARRNAENMKTKLGIDDRGPSAIDLIVDARYAFSNFFHSSQ